MADNTDKWWAYKLACFLFYGRHEDLTYPEPGVIHIAVPRVAQFLGLTSTKLLAYLERCAELGLITEYKKVRGFAWMRVHPPIACEVEHEAV